MLLKMYMFVIIVVLDIFHNVTEFNICTLSFISMLQ